MDLCVRLPVTCTEERPHDVPLRLHSVHMSSISISYQTWFCLHCWIRWKLVLLFGGFVCETTNKIPFHLKMKALFFLLKEDLHIGHKTFPLRSDNTHQIMKEKRKHICSNQIYIFCLFLMTRDGIDANLWFFLLQNVKKEYKLLPVDQEDIVLRSCSSIFSNWWVSNEHPPLPCKECPLLNLPNWEAVGCIKF